MAEKHATFHPGDGPTPRTAAGVIAAEEQRIRTAVDFERHFVESVGEINGMRRALRVLADAGLLVTAERDAEVRRAAIAEVWNDAAAVLRATEKLHQDVAAKALRDAAGALRAEFGVERSRSIGFGDPHDLSTEITDALDARAARIAAGETP